MSKISRMTKDLKKQYKPVGDISDVQSLESDNFVYSLLINSKFGHEIQGFSVVELSNFLKEKGVQNDYELFNMIFME